MNSSLVGLGDTPTTPTASDLIKDSDQTTFVQDVIEASKEVPVLVDFWAPWCGPCKQLGPIIESAVTKANGKIKLVKVNIDENQAIAQQMRVQSIPAVFAFAGGQPVDGFMGAKPEGEINAFIQKVLEGHGAGNDQLDAALEQAQTALEAEDFDTAGQIYMSILQVEATNLASLIGLARCQIAKEDFDGAAASLAMIASSDEQNPDVISVKAALELAVNPVDEADVLGFTAALEKNPDDFEARFNLANAYNTAGKKSEAIEELIYIFNKNRDWNDQAARKQLLTFFEAWGPTDDDTLSGRRQLSTAMFS